MKLQLQNLKKIAESYQQGGDQKATAEEDDDDDDDDVPELVENFDDVAQQS